MKVLIKALMPSFGDVVLCTGPIKVLKRQKKNENISVLTKFPEIFYNNPFIDHIFIYEDEALSSDYDRVIDLSTVNFADYENTAFNYAYLLGINGRDFQDLNPQIFLSEEEVERVKLIKAKWTANGKKICVVHPSTYSAHIWEGREWSLERFKSVIRMLQSLGYVTVEVGKGTESTKAHGISLVNQTSLRDLASMISISDLFIGIDSGPFHLAQAFKIKSIVIFGATEPHSRIIDFQSSSFVRKEGLPCIGCYNRQGVSNFNKCDRGTIECMKMLMAPYVANEIERMLDDPLYFAYKNIAYLQQLMRTKTEKLREKDYYKRYHNIHQEYLKYRKGYYAFFRLSSSIRKKIIELRRIALKIVSKLNRK